MGLLRHFEEHPASVGESYVGHLLQACLLHGLFPFLCVTTGSEAMQRLHAEMAARRAKACADAVPGPSPRR